MTRYSLFLFAVATAVVSATAALVSSPWWWLIAGPAAVIVVVGILDLVQTATQRSPQLPDPRSLPLCAGELRPELQQYFIERDTDGRPYDRNERSLIYERAKGVNEEQPFGTERDVYAPGAEWLVHSASPKSPSEDQHRVTVGGPQCARPYDMALLNVSAMSFGALSSNAIRALNEGARLGGFAHDTGEGGLSKYHLQHGGDLVWEIGSGYFGCRTERRRFRRRAVRRQGSERCGQVHLDQAVAGCEARDRWGDAGCEDDRGDRRSSGCSRAREVRVASGPQRVQTDPTG